MILTCPACATQYRLKDDAIPPEGRQVRCAACKHKWHEAGASAGDAAPEDEGAIGHWPPGSEPAAARDDDAGIGGGPPQPDPDHAEEVAATVPEAEAREQMIAETPEPDVTGQDQTVGHESEPRAPADQWSEPSGPYPPEDEGFAAIPAMRDEGEAERRSWLGWIIGLVLIVIAAVTAFYFFAPPEWKARAGIAEVGESALEVVLTTNDRQTLASGNEMVTVGGRVVNNTDRLQVIRPIEAELRDEASNKLVYKWTIAPPARSLAPGTAATFSSTELDVPAGADMLSLRFAS